MFPLLVAFFPLGMNIPFPLIFLPTHVLMAALLVSSGVSYQLWLPEDAAPRPPLLTPPPPPPVSGGDTESSFSFQAFPCPPPSWFPSLCCGHVNSDFPARRRTDGLCRSQCPG